MGASLSSPVYLDAITFFPNTSNILILPPVNVTKAFNAPVASALDQFSGYDWSKPFPATKLDGFQTHLTVASEVNINETLAQNASTVLTSITFDAPASLRNGGKPVAMDPSWYICRHIFITTKPSAKEGAKKDSTCGFLSDACRKDLRQSLTGNWGKAVNGSMCSALMYDPIPQSCFDTFGYSRQDAWGFDSDALASTEGGPLHTDGKQQRASFRIGTGYHNPYDPNAFILATNRTYLIATVWGYSSSLQSSSIRPPELSISCLASDADHIPQPPPPSSTASTPTSTSTVPTPTFTPIPSDTAYYDQFDNGMALWKVYYGSFNADSKALVAPDSNTGMALLNTRYSDFTFEADVTITGGSDSNRNPGFLFRVTDAVLGADNFHGYYAGINADGHVVLGSGANNWNQLASAPVDATVNKSHRLKVQAVGTKLTLWVDDMRTAKFTVSDNTYKSGMTGVRTYHTGAIFDDIQMLPLQFWDDFSSNTLSKWQTYSGEFDASQGVMDMKQSGGSMAIISDRIFDDFAMEVEITVSQNGDSGVVLRSSSPNDGNIGYYGYYVGMSNGKIVFGRVENDWTELSRKDAPDIQLGFNHLKVSAKGSIFSIFVNDMVAPKIVVSDATFKTGLAGVRVHDCMALVKSVAVYRA